jgi:hypothetical protein
MAGKEFLAGGRRTDCCAGILAFPTTEHLSRCPQYPARRAIWRTLWAMKARSRRLRADQSAFQAVWSTAHVHGTPNRPRSDPRARR